MDKELKLALYAEIDRLVSSREAIIVDVMVMEAARGNRDEWLFISNVYAILELRKLRDAAKRDILNG